MQIVASFSAKHSPFWSGDTNRTSTTLATEYVEGKGYPVLQGNDKFQHVGEVEPTENYDTTCSIVCPCGDTGGRGGPTGAATTVAPFTSTVAK
jgi:hypothetical protein